MQQEIIQESRTPDCIRETLDVVDTVLGFLSSGGGKADRRLGEYINHTLKMKGRPFSKKVLGISCVVTLALFYGALWVKYLFEYNIHVNQILRPRNVTYPPEGPGLYSINHFLIKLRLVTAVGIDKLSFFPIQ